MRNELQAIRSCSEMRWLLQTRISDQHLATTIGMLSQLPANLSNFRILCLFEFRVVAVHQQRNRRDKLNITQIGDMRIR